MKGQHVLLKILQRINNTPTAITNLQSIRPPDVSRHLSPCRSSWRHHHHQRTRTLSRWFRVCASWARNELYGFSTILTLYWRVSNIYCSSCRLVRRQKCPCKSGMYDQCHINELHNFIPDSISSHTGFLGPRRRSNPSHMCPSSEPARS